MKYLLFRMQEPSFWAAVGTLVTGVTAIAHGDLQLGVVTVVTGLLGAVMPSGATAVAKVNGNG